MFAEYKGNRNLNLRRRALEIGSPQWRNFKSTQGVTSGLCGDGNQNPNLRGHALEIGSPQWRKFEQMQAFARVLIVLATKKAFEVSRRETSKAFVCKSLF